MNQVRVLYEDKIEKGIEVPVMCSHFEQIKVYEKRLDAYLDFLNDNDVINVAKKCGYYSIQWDVDSLDWKDYGVDSIIKTVTEHKHLGNGSIILCHNGAKYTAQALETLITTLQDEGYEFVPISQLIYRDNYHMNHEGRQISS